MREWKGFYWALCRVEHCWQTIFTNKKSDEVQPPSGHPCMPPSGADNVSSAGIDITVEPFLYWPVVACKPRSFPQTQSNEVCFTLLAVTSLSNQEFSKMEIADSSTALRVDVGKIWFREFWQSRLRMFCLRRQLTLLSKKSCRAQKDTTILEAVAIRSFCIVLRLQDYFVVTLTELDVASLSSLSWWLLKT